jgi:hypothetical protein
LKTCLIDPDLLSNGEKYRITGRVGCMDDNGDIYDNGFV